MHMTNDIDGFKEIRSSTKLKSFIVLLNVFRECAPFVKITLLLFDKVRKEKSFTFFQNNEEMDAMKAIAET